VPLTARIVADPLATAVTFPKLTVAILSSFDDQTIAPEAPMAVSCVSPPTLRWTVFGLTESVEELPAAPGGVKSEHATKALTIPAAAIATTRPA
jgi:hypothetical protein